MKKLFAIALVTVAVTASSLARAQFSMPSVGGLGGKSGSSAPAADLSGQQTALVRNFVVASKEVLTANEKMADALGLKAQAAKSGETANAMSEGASKGNLEDANKVVADTGGAIKEALAKKPVLDEKAKARYAEGMVHLVAGAVKYAGLGKDVKDMGVGLKSASPMQLPNLGSAAYIVSKFPGSASDLYNTLQTAIEFAREQKIPLPASTEDAFKALGGSVNG